MWSIWPPPVLCKPWVQVLQHSLRCPQFGSLLSRRQHLCSSRILLLHRWQQLSKWQDVQKLYTSKRKQRHHWALYIRRSHHIASVGRNYDFDSNKSVLYIYDYLVRLIAHVSIQPTLLINHQLLFAVLLDIHSKHYTKHTDIEPRNYKHKSERFCFKQCRCIGAVPKPIFHYLPPNTSRCNHRACSAISNIGLQLCIKYDNFRKHYTRGSSGYFFSCLV